MIFNQIIILTLAKLVFRKFLDITITLQYHDHYDITIYFLINKKL